MKKLAAWALVFGYAVLFTNPAGATTRTQLDFRLLSISNMPTGWSIDNSLNGGTGGIPCLKSIKSPATHQEKASVAYKDGSLPAVQEVVATGRGVSASYKKLNHALSDCKSFTYSTGGQRVTGTIGPLSFPSVGATSSAYTVTLNVQGANAGIDVVLFKSGRYVGAVLYESLGTPDSTQAQAFVNEAVSKVGVKPVVVPTTV